MQDRIPVDLERRLGELFKALYEFVASDAGQPANEIHISAKFMDGHPVLGQLAAAFNNPPADTPKPEKAVSRDTFSADSFLQELLKSAGRTPDKPTKKPRRKPKEE